jgi:hypothetical protein
LGEGYTEEAIKQKILEKPERKTEEPPPQKRISQTAPPTIAPPIEKPPTLKPLIDIAGNPKYAESRGLEQWAKLQNLKMTAEAFMLMQEYGGMDAFMELYNECKTDVATLENGIKANDEQLKTLVDRRESIITYNRTKPIYKQYEETKTKFFKERFRKANERDIVAYEYAEMDLRYVPSPLPTVKELDTKIARIKTANVKNNTQLTKLKTDMKQLNTIHSYLYHLRLTHQPPPQRQQQQTRTKTKRNDLSL